MFLILSLLFIFCALNLSSEQYVANPLNENNTSVLLAKFNISGSNEEFSTSVTERKSKVKKRPGVSVYPTPSIGTTAKYFDMLESDVHRNSSTVPRKGAGDPPPLNEMNSILNFTHSTNFSTGNLSNDTEMIHSVEQISPNLNNASTMTANSAESTKTPHHLVDVDLPLINESKVLNKTELKSEVNITSTTDSSKSNQTAADIDKVSYNPQDTTPDFATQSAQTNLSNTQFSSRKPSIASAIDTTKTTSTPAIVAAVVIVILVCSLLGFITYKRLFAYWNRRHYSRVDFLIDGLYEM